MGLCPQCFSSDLRPEPYDFGRCSQTGYHDAGVKYICQSCGTVSGEDELLYTKEDSEWARKQRKQSIQQQEKT